MSRELLEAAKRLWDEYDAGEEEQESKGHRLAVQLHELNTVHGWTQQQIADEVGRSQGTVNHWCQLGARIIGTPNNGLSVRQMLDEIRTGHVGLSGNAQTVIKSPKGAADAINTDGIETAAKIIDRLDDRGRKAVAEAIANRPDVSRQVSKAQWDAASRNPAAQAMRRNVKAEQAKQAEQMETAALGIRAADDLTHAIQLISGFITRLHEMEGRMTPDLRTLVNEAGIEIKQYGQVLIDAANGEIAWHVDEDQLEALLRAGEAE